MKEIKLEEIVPLEAMKSKIWLMFDILRSENISSDDYHLVLFLLSAYKDNILSIDLIDENRHLKESLIERLRKTNSELDHQYVTIFHSFEPSIQKLSDYGLRNLFSVFAQINKPYLIDNFPDVFDGIMYQISQSQGRHAGNFIQPAELSRFMFGLADLKKDAKVYNPFAGMASFGVFLDPGQNYFGQELDQRTWALGTLRLLAHGRSSGSKYLCDDSIVHWPDMSEKFDLIISSPPFGIRLGNQYKDIEPVIRTIEQFLIEKGIPSLKQNGKLIALLPQGFLFRGMHDRRVREYLVDEDLIDIIISLPSGLLLNTGIPLVILVLSKKKKLPGKVKFVDAKNHVTLKGPREKVLNDEELLRLIKGTSIFDDSDHQNMVKEPFEKYISTGSNKVYDMDCLVDIGQIKENDYNLNVARYFQKQIDGEKLGDIIEPLIGKRGNLPVIGKLLRIRDLKDDNVDFLLNDTSLKETELNRYHVQQIDESCLLFAIRWKTLKPTFFEYKSNPIFKSSDIFSAKIKKSKVDQVNIAYLINELKSEYVQKQLDSYRLGATIPFIRKDDLMEIVIKLPSIEEQKKKYYSLVDEYIKSKVQESEIKYDERRIDIEDENSFLRHQIAGSLKNIRGAFKFVQKIINEQVKNQVPNLDVLKADERLETTFFDYMNIIERDLVSINKAVSKAGDKIDLLDLNIESFDLLEFIKEYANSLKIRANNLFTVELDLDENAIVEYGISAIYISGDKDIIRKMFDNIIENAERHAFTNSIDNCNKIKIELLYDFEDSSVQIDISNTGKPLPENISHDALIRKGSTSGQNSGNGLGLWYVNEVMKIHKGRFGFTDKTGSEGIKGEYVTTMELKFPIIPVNNENL